MRGQSVYIFRTGYIVTTEDVVEVGSFITICEVRKIRREVFGIIKHAIMIGISGWGAF